MVRQSFEAGQLLPVRGILQNPSARFNTRNGDWQFESRSGYEIFVFDRPADSFIWSGQITVEGMGKFGLVTDMDEEGNGYFISFDVTNGLVQIRAWGFNSSNNQQNFVFNNIQSNIFKTQSPFTFRFQLIRYGHYIEVSVDGLVRLTLIDYTYSGIGVGVYTASSVIALNNIILQSLPVPESEYGSQEQASKE